MSGTQFEPAAADCIPHTCLFCQKEVVRPVWNEDFRVGWSFTFRTNGEEALEAASKGCTLWKWYIRDYLDEWGRYKNPQFIPSQVYFYLAFPTDATEEDALQLDQVHMNRGAKYPGGSMTSHRGSFRIIAKEG